MLGRKRRAAATAAVATLSVLLAACGPSAANRGSASSDALVFAAIPSEDSSSLRQDYRPVLDMLEAETGKEVRFQQATDYAAIIEDQRAGKIDIAKYGPFSYVLARKKGVEATAVAAQTEKKGKKPGYQSYAITRPGTGIDSLADFAGEKVCFVDPTSTSGYLYPTAGLLEAGVDPKTDIRPIMSGGHDASALAVASGQCAAGFAFDTMVSRQLIEQGQLEPGQLEVVWRSEVIPGDPAVVSEGLAPKLRETITSALRNKANSDYLRAHGFCTGKCRVGDTGGWGFTRVDDSYYDTIRRVCATTRNKQCV
ncbi:phosphate/phosphite/phosphonate ABC transporter substrate-binding protein [Haloactinomyces albus]|uniref:Phosphonate transport system substrate-binding protein n=1 Tax=Haloactinomyces albus TaxID=1352928 RepID=A0AAE4CM79_9ACTN|nr:phosphate/phosphite/phosphonate ABC transporter substrate-binding protein [Haloactinomyces albus]MDR7302604.1 phosphonate transport system substrate-binding protein [Haloactinomyces albus]